MMMPIPEDAKKVLMSETAYNRDAFRISRIDDTPKRNEDGFSETEGENEALISTGSVAIDVMDFEIE
jgi:hypothetical protein